MKVILFDLMPYGEELALLEVVELLAIWHQVEKDDFHESPRTNRMRQ